MEPSDGNKNAEIAKPKTYDLTGTIDSADSEFPYVQYLVCEYSATPTAADTLPIGTINFFTTTSCPDNWTALVTTDDGFLVVPTPTGCTPSTKPSGDGWNPSSLPTHDHGFGGKIDLIMEKVNWDVSDKGAKWTQGKDKMTATATGSAKSHSMGLPLTPYILCQRTKMAPHASRGQTYVKGMTIFTVSSCNGTGGFVAISKSMGRLLVGCNECTTTGTNPLGETFGAVSPFVGSTSYSASHTHDHSGQSSADSYKKNKGSTRYVKATTLPLSGTTDSSSVSLPAFTLNHCVAPSS